MSDVSSHGGIEEITIRDLGVIADATLPLTPGFTAITGETGAGKTMLVTALGLLLGERADSSAVRSGQPQAWVEGRWRIPDSGPLVERVRDAGGEVDVLDETTAELVLGRSVSAESRSRAVVGGRSAPVSVLAELAESLVVVHGQSDQVRLRSTTAQRDALDRFAGSDFAARAADYEQVFRRWRANREELVRLSDDQAQRTREADDLRAALREIEDTDPQPGEDDELTQRAERLSNAEELRQAAATAREALSAEEADGVDVLGLLDQARRSLQKVAAYDPNLGELSESIETLNYQVSDVAVQLSSFLATLEEDGERDLELVQERRAHLASLTRKFGPTLDDVIRLRQTGSERLSDLDGDSDRLDTLAAHIAHDEKLLLERADDLTQRRHDAGERFGQAVSRELAALAMPDAIVTVEITVGMEFTAHGRDQVAILLRPHTGADPRPLGKGASGGELSRVMLAIEVVLAGTNPVPTFVFDEIDAGVGGAAAIEIGRRLARLATDSQVIVVTHLAQIAAFATNHLCVVKGSDDAVTTSSVRRLEGLERTAEMARLLSGLSGSESALAHARELVELAENDLRDDKL